MDGGQSTEYSVQTHYYCPVHVRRMLCMHASSMAYSTLTPQNCTICYNTQTEQTTRPPATSPSRTKHLEA